MSLPTLSQYTPAKISLTKPKKNKNGKGESQWINTEEFKEKYGGNVVFEIKDAIVQYTIKPYDPEANPTTQGLKLHIRKDESNASIMELFNKIEEYEQFFGSIMDDKSKEWFFKQRKAGQSYGKVSSCISEHTNKKDPNNPYPDTLRISVPFDYETPYRVKNFHDAETLEEMKLIHSAREGSELTPIGDKVLNGSSGNFTIRMGNIWHSSGNWGIKLSLVRAVVNCKTYNGGSMILPPLVAPTIKPIETRTETEDPEGTGMEDDEGDDDDEGEVPDEEEGEMVEADEEEEVEVPKKRGRKKI